MTISGYSSPYNLGHRALANFWQGTVYVQTKEDGSQFSFQLGTDDVLRARSHHNELILDAVEKMFAPTVATVQKLHADGLLIPGYTYRGEAFCKPRHNTLNYGRVPKGNVILFDVDKGDQDYMLPGGELEAEAERLGLECVPLIAVYTERPSLDELHALLDREDVLGNTKIEGWVAKNYSLFDPTSKRTLMCKLVNSLFREVNKADFRERNPKQGDIILRLIDTYGTQARWNKAIQHLREQGLIKGEPQDIGTILKEINEDVLRECKAEIMETLFAWAWKDVSRGITKGFPEAYKQQLAEAQFEN